MPTNEVFLRKKKDMAAAGLTARQSLLCEIYRTVGVDTLSTIGNAALGTHLHADALTALAYLEKYDEVTTSISELRAYHVSQDHLWSEFIGFLPYAKDYAFEKIFFGVPPRIRTDIMRNTAVVHFDKLLGNGTAILGWRDYELDALFSRTDLTYHFTVLTPLIKFRRKGIVRKIAQHPSTQLTSLMQEILRERCISYTPANNSGV
jgi:hypothetical protein